MGEISNIFRGSSPRPKGSPLYWSNERTNYHWITISDISNFSQNSMLYDTKEFLTELGKSLSTFVNEKELIIAVSGSTTGKACLTNINGYIYDGLAAVRIINSILPQYLLIFIQFYYETLNNSKTGSAFPNINTDILKHTLFPLPPLLEQQRIVDKIEELIPLCKAMIK